MPGYHLVANEASLRGTWCLSHMLWCSAFHHPLSQHNMWCWTEVLLQAAPWQQCLWISLLWSAAVWMKLQNPPYTTTGMLFVYSYWKDCLPLLSVCLRVYQPPEQLVSALRGSTGWSLAMVPQVRMQLHIFPEVENLFPVVWVCLQMQWRSYSFLQLVLLLVIICNNKDVKV